MIHDTIAQLRGRLEASGALKPEAKSAVLGLLETLKSEVNELSATHADQARSIAGFTQVSAHEATRERPDTRLKELSIEGLRASVAGFEESHPKLAAAVNRVCMALSNLGI
ncbi:MAG: DUF4404 family protein [Verrucomicrobia bacterium]|nr:DUF4404 family protein [Verrucomicrobiota bacterium]